MRGKIDEEGVLYIDRAGKLKNVWCRQSIHHDRGQMFCCDECSLFGEPDITSFHLHESKEGVERYEAKLSLCKRELIFSDFADERE